jgi:rhamnosyltransferase
VADPRATVVVLTYNGETYLDDLLLSVEAQEGAGETEILVIDSGSSDGTLDILRAHPTVRLVEIPNAEFSHGRTRDQAARLARGRYVAYLTQDAIPAGSHWLAELLLPFELDDRVALVTGRQIPRARAFPLQKYEIVGAFRALGPDDATTLHGGWVSPPAEREVSRAAFHSDVNAAVRRARVIDDLPFRDVPYAEDQMMGREVIESGALKAYAGRAAVIHSNDLTLREFGRRIFDETVGLRRIGTPIARLRLRSQLALTLKGVLRDSFAIARDPDFGVATKLRWLVTNPAYHARKWSQYRRAALVDLADERRIEKSSLESVRKTT